jgi:hypothetical protein
MAPDLLVGTAEGLHSLGGEGVEFVDRDVSALAARDGLVCAVIDRHAVWARDAGGWRQRAALRVLELTCLAATRAGLLVGTSEAHLFRLEGNRLTLVEAFEHAEGRDGWYTPWGGPPATRWIAEAPDGTLYVNVHVGGILRAVRLDGAWEATIDVDADVHQVLTADGSLVLAATANGLASSADGGDSWEFSSQGLHARYLRAVAVADDAVLVSASTGPAGRQAAVYRRELSRPGRFVRCEQGLPAWFSENIDTGCLVAAGTAVAFAAPTGQVYGSEDAGRRWALLADGLPAVRCLIPSASS